MPAISDDQIASYALNALGDAQKAITAVAISLAESGGRPDAKGDVNLQDRTWGPSLGLWQERTLNNPGNNWTRNAAIIGNNPQKQADAMAVISSNGTNWGPWTMYKNGGYKQYLARATVAVQNAQKGVISPTNPVTPSGSDTTAQPTGFGDSLSGAGNFFSQLTKASTWIRVGEVVFGGILILLGMTFFVKGQMRTAI